MQDNLEIVFLKKCFMLITTNKKIPAPQIS